MNERNDWPAGTWGAMPTRVYNKQELIDRLADLEDYSKRCATEPDPATREVIETVQQQRKIFLRGFIEAATDSQGRLSSRHDAGAAQRTAFELFPFPRPSADLRREGIGDELVRYNPCAAEYQMKQGATSPLTGEQWATYGAFVNGVYDFDEAKLLIELRTRPYLESSADRAMDAALNAFADVARIEIMTDSPPCQSVALPADPFEDMTSLDADSLARKRWPGRGTANFTGSHFVVRWAMTQFQAVEFSSTTSWKEVFDLADSLLIANVRRS